MFYGQRSRHGKLTWPARCRVASSAAPTFTGGWDITAVGRRSSLGAFAAAWNYVRAEVMRLRDRAWKTEREKERDDAEQAWEDSTEQADLRSKARRWRRAFCSGAVRTVGDRLRENLKRLSTAPSEISTTGVVLAQTYSDLALTRVTALALARQTEVDAWLKANGPQLRSTRRQNGHNLDVHDAYEKGQRAGRAIDLAPRPTKFLGD